MSSSKEFTLQLLATADIRINGGRPWDLQVHDERMYDRIVAQGSLGLGESYMDGWWDCEDLVEMVFRLFRCDIVSYVPHSLRTVQLALSARLFNRQTKKRSTKVAKQHYDLGNDFYGAMLDPYRQYSCAYFKDTDDLATAQEKKMDLICRKLQLKPGESLLDIGCGWGGLAKFAAERYGCHVTGISISDRQVEFAREFTRGLPIEILKQDYRDLTGTYDKVVSVGMVEHVGSKNYRTLMRTVRRCLKDEGLFLLHSIGTAASNTHIDPWIDRYIFPNSQLPSAAQLAGAADGLFVLEDWHNFGISYMHTLIAWYQNFERHWPRFAEQYGERFRRMWTFYLLICAAGFKARGNQLWQMVWSPRGMLEGYESVR